jgi:hypothetical protein
MGTCQQTNENLLLDEWRDAVQKGLVVKQRHQAPQGVKQIVIEVLDRNRLVGAISSEARHLHVSTRERDGARVQHQSQSQVRFVWRGARDVRNN